MALLLEPGEIPKAFREGRTVRYMPALRLYFFVSLAFFLILSTAGIAIVQFEVTAKPDQDDSRRERKLFHAQPGLRQGRSGFANVQAAHSKFRKSGRSGPEGFTISPQPAFLFADRRLSLDADAGAARANHGGQEPSGSKLSRLQGRRQRQGKDRESQKIGGAITKTIFTAASSRLAADPAALNGPLTTWIPRMLFPAAAAICIFARRVLLAAAQEILFRRPCDFLADRSYIPVCCLDRGCRDWRRSCPMTIVVSADADRAGSIYIHGDETLLRARLDLDDDKFVLVSFVYSMFFLAPALAGVIAISFFGDPFG